MSEGILALDTNFKIININEAAKNLLLSKGSKHKLETNTEAYEEIIQVLEKLNIKAEFNSVISNSEKRIMLKEHSNKVIEFSIASIKNNLNEIIGAVILIQDISEKEKLEQMRKDFISNVSHEFRTPLSIIKGNLESILDGMTKKEDIPNTCTTLINETNRLERMVKDLLNLSRLEAGKLEVNFQELDVNNIIKDTLRGLRPLINNKEIKVELFMEELPGLLNDYDKLKQLLLIFLDNAIKFSNNKGLLQISTHNDKESINITIKDEGCGIPKGEIEYLGERFYKADKARNSGGTGLGLSIAKRLIKILNGSFSIESEEGKGTTIIISIYRKSK
jgi:Signal transduction histidine kinase